MLTRILLLFALTVPAFALAEDGDTIWLDGQKIRLWGIDAPEKRQPYGLEAGVALKAMRQEMLTPDARGRSYDRVVGLVPLRNGSTAQAEMIRLGLAWVEPRYCRVLFPCLGWKVDEARAKERRLGLWADDDPTPPWVWRKRKRGLE